MKLSRDGLKRLALTNVVEIKFVRRDKTRLPKTRRMFMTLDVMLLNSTLGKKVLRFKKPVNMPSYNAATKNLLFVWDIIMQGWRAVPIESTVVIHAESTRPQKNFWDFFNKTLKNMTPSQKASFMDI
jgi:hypothetical protein